MNELFSRSDLKIKIRRFKIRREKIFLNTKLVGYGSEVNG